MKLVYMDIYLSVRLSNDEMAIGLILVWAYAFPCRPFISLELSLFEQLNSAKCSLWFMCTIYEVEEFQNILYRL